MSQSLTIQDHRGKYVSRAGGLKRYRYLKLKLVYEGRRGVALRSFRAIFFSLACLFTISCTDNQTQSGIQKEQSKDQLEPHAMTPAQSNVEGFSRSSDCESTHQSVRYVDEKLNKVLARCDSVNQLFSYTNRPESATVLSQWLRNWCTRKYGGSTTIIDTNEQQCSIGTGAFSAAAVGYVNKYADLLSSYNATNLSQSKSLWGTNHYCASGRYEGRTYPGLSAASCGTSGTTSGSATSWPSGNYDYLCKYNECDRFSYRTRRWRTNSVNIISTNSIYYNGLRGSWPVNFNLGSRGGITIESGSGNWCGVAMPLMYTDGTIRACRIKINNVAHAARRCGLLKATVIHEVGHCLGFLGHTTDGGLMDATANQATGANSNTRNMISLLYSLPPGTDISSRLSTLNRSGTEQIDSYEFDGSDPTLIPPKWYYSK